MTAAISSPTFRDPREPAFRLSVEKFDEMVRVGVLDEDDAVELLEGLLISKMPTDPPHDVMVGVIPDALAKLLPAGWFTRAQATLALPDSRPEPDVAVARGQPFDYLTRHPGPADLALLIEVSDATLARDRGTKLRIYARAGIVEYWIVNLIDRQIEVHRSP